MNKFKVGDKVLTIYAIHPTVFIINGPPTGYLYPIRGLPEGPLVQGDHIDAREVVLIPKDATYDQLEAIKHIVASSTDE